MTPTRVWLAPSAYHPSLGGIEELTSRVAHELAHRGHAVEVITNRWPADLPLDEPVATTMVHRRDMPELGMHPRRLIAYPSRERRTELELEELATRFRPNLVHAIGASWQAFHLARLAGRRGIPFILTLQGETAMDDHSAYLRGARSLFIRAQLRAAAAKAAAITACSQWALKHAATIVPGLHGQVVPNGVAVVDFAAVPPPPQGGPLLAYGRLVRNKGFDLLLDAWTGMELDLEIGGSGPEAEELARRATGTGGRVRLLGRLDREQLTRAMARACAVVMPSRLEPFGMVALEGMAAGRPVVASAIGGAPEFVRGGVLVDPFDADALRAAVRRCVAEPELGLEGRAAAARYDWAEVTSSYEEIYARTGA